MSRKTILIIDASKSLGMSIQNLFTHIRANILMVHDEVDGVRELKRLRPDLIIMDIELSDTSDIDLVRNIRQITSAPIMVVGGIDNRDEFNCLDAGADDFMSKPYNMDVFLARVNAILRRTEKQIKQGHIPIYDDGNLTVDLMAYKTMVGGRWVKLTNRIQVADLSSHQRWGDIYI